jgi:hypothetical protein
VDIDKINLKPETEEKTDKLSAVKDKEHFIDFIRRGFQDINPNIKKHDP